MIKTKAEFEAEQKLLRKEGYSLFMDQPATRMMLSMIPPGEKQDVLETLLQETYNSGFSCGSATALISVMDSMISREIKNQR